MFAGKGPPRGVYCLLSLSKGRGISKIYMVYYNMLMIFFAFDEQVNPTALSRGRKLIPAFV